VLEVGKHSSGIILKFQAKGPIAQAQEKDHETNSIIYTFTFYLLPSTIHSNVSCRVAPKRGVGGGCQAAVPTQTEILKNQIL